MFAEIVLLELLADRDVDTFRDLVVLLLLAVIDSLEELVLLNIFVC